MKRMIPATTLAIAGTPVETNEDFSESLSEAAPLLVEELLLLLFEGAAVVVVESDGRGAAAVKGLP